MCVSYFLNPTHFLCGWNHSLFIDTTASVYGCGENSWKQVGVDNVFYEVESVVPQHALKKVRLGGTISIACGAEHSLVLLENGEVLASGRNQHGQFGLPSPPKNSYRKRYSYSHGICRILIEGLPKIASVYSGEFHSLFQEAGTVWACGSIENSTACLHSPEKLELPPIIEISCGSRFTVLLDCNRTLWYCGNSEFLGAKTFEVWGVSRLQYRTCSDFICLRRESCCVSL